MESKTEGEREQFIKETKDFIEKECAEIGELLANLSWTPDRILKGGSVVQCPYNAGHLMPELSLKRHSRVCRLKKIGLSSEERETELRNDDVFYEKANLVGKVQLDEGLLNRILWNHCMENRQVHMGHRPMPVSWQDYVVKLSNQERLAVYEYCVKTMKEEGKMANVEQDEVLTTDWEKIVKKGMLDEAGERPKTKFELLTMLRDQKRRRQTYRAKNVHITRKSYTEIIREVIQNQMEIMIPSAEIKTEQEEDKDKDTATHDDRDSSHRSRHSQRSRSRQRSCSHTRNRSRSRSPRRSRSPSHQQRRRRDDESYRYSKRRYYDSKEKRRSRSRSRRSTERDRHSNKRQKREEENSKNREEEESKNREEGEPPKPEESISRKSPGRDSGEKKESANGSSHSEAEEGQIESDNDDGDSSHQGQRKSSSKKKSSKHKKKNKHKKHHKSKSRRSDSD